MAWGPLSGSSSQVITSAAAFTPSDIGGLLQFLESDRGVTAPTDDKVTIWADEQSGDDRDVTQTSDASRPIETASIFDTNPGLLFDGVNDRLDRAYDTGFNFDYTDPFYVIVGIQMASDFTTGGLGQLAGQFGTTQPNGWDCRYFTDGKLQFVLQKAYGGGTGPYTSILGGTTLAADGKYLVEMWNTAVSNPFAYTDLNIWVNGSDDSPTEQWDGLGSDSITGGNNPYNIGSRHDGAFPVDGYYACVGIYGSVPNTDERISLRSYLNDKYGFY